MPICSGEPNTGILGNHSSQMPWHLKCCHPSISRARDGNRKPSWRSFSAVIFVATVVASIIATSNREENRWQGRFRQKIKGRLWAAKQKRGNPQRYIKSGFDKYFHIKSSSKQYHKPSQVIRSQSILYLHVLRGISHYFEHIQRKNNRHSCLQEQH